ncbi:MAG: PaaI family thioesterase [Acidimicrobiales bacterium]
MSGTHAHPDDTSPARVAAAAAVRRLVHALVAHDGDDETLARLAATASALGDELEQAPDRHRGTDSFPNWATGSQPEGAVLSCVDDCMVAGPANPLSAGTRIHREGDEAVLRVTLDPGFEGLPGRAHGGIVASLFDEAMGQVLYMEGERGFTAWLRVDYRAPVLTGVPIEIRARLKERDGRKFLVEAELSNDGQPGPTAESLYVTPRPEP